MAMADRFTLLSESDLKKLEDKSYNKNMQRSTINWISIFKEWALIRGKNVNLEEYEPQEMDSVLRVFYAELRKKDGNNYEPDSLRVM